MQCDAARPLHRPEQAARQRLEVDVGAGPGPRGRHFLRRVAAGHHQRHPLGQPAAVVRVLHALEQRMPAQRLAPLSEERDVRVAADETDVRDRVDEVARRGEIALPHQGGPELPGDLELLVDLQGLRHVHRAVRALGRVVQLAEGGVARAGVVVDARALPGHVVQPLEHLDRPARLERLQQRPHGGAHDPAADERRVDGFAVRHEPYSSEAGLRPSRPTSLEPETLLAGPAKRGAG